MEQGKVDFIIVGQGVAGSWLAYELLERNKTVHIFNQETSNISTLKAAGLYNPITGRKMVKTWLADELFHDLEDRYQGLEKRLSSNFLHKMPIYRPFISAEEKNDWDTKLDNPAFTPYIHTIVKDPLYQQIHNNLGGVVLKRTGFVNLSKFIAALRSYFTHKGSYTSEVFDYTQMRIQENGVVYRDAISADKIIFCEGPLGSNPFWGELPFKHVRGEIIDIECDLKSKHIINRGVFMIPKDGYFTVGSTYDHKVLSFEPQKEGINDLKGRLGKLFMGNYRIREERAGVRPATFDRKPFIGLHKKFKHVGIFNGFGTKGVSLTPYFANQFASFLLGHSEIEKEAHVQRVY